MRCALSAIVALLASAVCAQDLPAEVRSCDASQVAPTRPQPRIACPTAAAHSLGLQDWGYVQVRPAAHVFWWIYRGARYSDPNAPLISWQQGGPGASSTGFGNFVEVGPLDMQLQPRNTSWTNATGALLFIDSPVGTGFSYVTNASALTTDNEQIARDYVTVLTHIFNKYPGLSARPYYMFCESFGGHMVPQYATTLLESVNNGTIKANLAGIALGDSWVSGVAFTNTWVPYLRSLSVLDAKDAQAIQPLVDQTAQAVKDGSWYLATELWGELESAIMAKTDDVDWYFVLWHNQNDDDLFIPQEHDRTGRHSTLSKSFSPLARRQLAAYHADSLSALMNGPIRQKLTQKIGFDIPSTVTWGGQSGDVFNALNVEFMKDISPVVDNLLKTTSISVNIYQGSLDLICCTPGADEWMSTLTWSGMQGFYNAARTSLYPSSTDRNTGAFVKASGRLAMYYLLRSGHMAPGDYSVGGMPDTMYNVMETIIGA
jgi:serine carboxypeptidase 1